LCKEILPQENRAQETPDARCTRSPACKIKQAHERNHHRYLGTPDVSCAMVLTAYVVLSPATNSSCHRHRRINGFAGPGRVKKTSADLAPATGARTTRFCRPRPSAPKASAGLVPIRRSFGEGVIAPFVSAHLIAHRSKDPPCDRVARPALPRPPHPIPTSVTIAIRPSCGMGQRDL
jgi:hypothetical protein